MDEWLSTATKMISVLRETLGVMEARIADGITQRREASAAAHVRDAMNLLRMATLLVWEDAKASGVQGNVEDHYRIAANGVSYFSGEKFFDFEVHCANELAHIAGLFGEALHVHYLVHHPEAMPNRHWMVMQALSGSFQHLLGAISDMSCANEARVKQGE